MIIGTIYFYCRVLGFMVERFMACGFGSEGLGGSGGYESVSVSDLP